MALSYVAIRVINLDTSLKFYTEDLGLKVIDTRSHMPGETIISLVDEKSGQRLNMMHYTEECKLYTPYKLDGVELDHLMFEVDDAKKIFNELVSKGAPVAMDLVERTTDAGVFAMGLIKDPNGIWIGFRSQSPRPNGH
jgi:catechol 2,3-dioxygenase-like lactoylglutathione lyase family enzyme